MYGHRFTRYLIEVEEAMRSKQNYFWRKKKTNKYTTGNRREHYQKFIFSDL